MAGPNVPSANKLQEMLAQKQKQDKAPDGVIQPEAKPPGTSTVKQSEGELVESKKYQFNTAPCTVRICGVRTAMPDGTYTTDIPEEIAELDAKVKQRLCKDITKNPQAARNTGETIPEPASKIVLDQASE